ncbi:FecR family protein [Larkinella soli]|uniref:FecR family protein n=1 Tax=Larkinella soli TaxID=1770527 RepID=UPI000FFB9462|nr:FecR domain-containing protein [Larkinella soli]
MKTQVSKESLFNYFGGRATALQKQLIDEWAKEEENREFFFECLAVWETQNLQFSADAGDALHRHRERMTQQPLQAEEEPAAGPETRSLRSGWFRLRWLVAATVGLALTFGALRYRSNLLFITYRTAFGETRMLTLADGSRVTLNANSTLQVPRFGFGQKNRQVILAGEADFSIRHLPDHRNFTVRTHKNFEVVVLGTEFMVNTRERSKKVVLNKGKVKLLYQEGAVSRQLTMKPGNLVTFDQKGRVNLKQTPNPQVFTSWKDHRFVFEETTLGELGSLFTENYGLRLQFADRGLMQWTVSGAFTANSAEELIEILASASNLTYRRQGDTIVIDRPH